MKLEYTATTGSVFTPEVIISIVDNDYYTISPISHRDMDDFQIPAIPQVWNVPTLDCKLAAAKHFLGERWLLHPKHSPKKGDYDPWGKK